MLLATICFASGSADRDLEDNALTWTLKHDANVSLADSLPGRPRLLSSDNVIHGRLS